MRRCLTENSSFKGLALSNYSKSRVVNIGRLMVGLLSSSLILASVIGSDANALGVGAAKANSYIGEPLSVSVPLFNVVDPNSLSINLTSKQFDADGASSVSAKLDRSNSQLSVKLTSDSVVNEPYLTFTLSLVDNNAEFSKEFNVLMDLPAASRGNTILAKGLSVNSNSSSSFTSAPFQTVDQYRTSSKTSNVMGPYDTAQAGQIANQFGAVLDGQSLWRVARRINAAMGASRNQMMWGLYQANPDAFSSRSISSLKAGSYLTIPDQSVVKSLTDSQAKIKIAATEAHQQSQAPASSSQSVANTYSSAVEFGVDGNIESATQISSNDARASDPNNSVDQPSDVDAAASPFQVTGIGTAAVNAAEADQSSQQIITSLTQTVGNLSQQLSRKDQKIDFLEKQVSILKDYIGDETMGQPLALDPVPPEPSNVDQNTPAAEVNPDVATASPSPTPVWQWALLCLLALAGVANFMRDRLYALGQSLNLFGSNDQVEFDSLTEQDFSDNYVEVHQEPKLEPSQTINKKDYSVLSAVAKTQAEKDMVEGISYLDLSDDGSYQENHALELEPQEIVVDAEALSFDQRFEQLLAEEDFEFALELLNFARHNEINDERYHCERLHLFQKKSDDDGFYQYYYEIESQIPSFSPNLQTQISQLVVQLAHQ